MPLRLLIQPAVPLSTRHNDGIDYKAAYQALRTKNTIQEQRKRKGRGGAGPQQTKKHLNDRLRNSEGRSIIHYNRHKIGHVKEEDDNNDLGSTSMEDDKREKKLHGLPPDSETCSESDQISMPRYMSKRLTFTVLTKLQLQKGANDACSNDVRGLRTHLANWLNQDRNKPKLAQYRDQTAN
ncbi:hypothetical protein B0H10DRAFT_1946894 [Mycena sp. CBHHK59/15]|nr:hypothetical protein B0H10DRAFT_1946894 [Mycena sp. CBHHK59/15]